MIWFAWMLGGLSFLRRLDGAQLALGNWETGFIESNIGRVFYSAGEGRGDHDGLAAEIQARL